MPKFNAPIEAIYFLWTNFQRLHQNVPSWREISVTLIEPEAQQEQVT